MFLSTSNLNISQNPRSENSKILPYLSRSRSPDFPWRLAPRADASSCQSNLSGEICRTSFGTCFLGGGKGMGSKIVFGRIFLFLRIFVVEIENYFLFQKKSIGGPVLQISFMTSINSRHHWQHEYLYSDLVCPSFWVRFFIKIIDFRNHPLNDGTEFRHYTAAKKTSIHSHFHP